MTAVCADQLYMAMVVDTVADLISDDKVLDNLDGCFLAGGVARLVASLGIPIRKVAPASTTDLRPLTRNTKARLAGGHLLAAIAARSSRSASCVASCPQSKIGRPATGTSVRNVTLGKTPPSMLNGVKRSIHEGPGSSLTT